MVAAGGCSSEGNGNGDNVSFEEAKKPGEIEKEEATGDIILEKGDGPGKVGAGRNYKGIGIFSTYRCVPSFTALNEQLYILDALNFRILILNYKGSLLETINLPKKDSRGTYILYRDIAVTDKSVFLLVGKQIHHYDYKGNIISVITEESVESFFKKEVLRTSIPRENAGQTEENDLIVLETGLYTVESVVKNDKGITMGIEFRSPAGLSRIYVDAPSKNLTEQKWDMENNGRVEDIDRDYIQLMKNTGNYNARRSGKISSSFSFRGIKNIRIDRFGNLRIKNPNNNIIYIYKKIDGDYRICCYKLGEHNMFVDSNQFSYIMKRENGKDSSRTHSYRQTYIYRQKEENHSFFAKLGDNDNIGHWGKLVGIDNKDRIYIDHTTGYPQALEAEDTFIRVYDQEGSLKNSYPVIAWPGAPMLRYIVVDKEGIIFTAEFNEETEVMRIKRLN